MNVYEQSNEVEKALSEAIDEETGEIIDEGKFELFEKLQGDFNTKVLSLAKYLRDKRIHLKNIKDEAKRFRAKQKTLEKNIDWLENYIMICWNGEKLEDIQVKLKRNVGTTEISNEEFVPDKYKTEVTKVEVKIDRSAIKADILNGEKVNGAFIKPTLRVS